MSEVPLQTSSPTPCTLHSTPEAVSPEPYTLNPEFLRRFGAVWCGVVALCERDWYFHAEQPAPAPHLAHPE